MREKVFFVISVLFPSMFLITYVLVERNIDFYYMYNTKAKLIFEICANAIVGMYLLLLCKRTFHKQLRKVHIDNVIGIIVVIVIFLLTLMPKLNFGILYFFIGFCVPQFIIIFTVNTGIFIYEIKHKIGGNV